MDGLKWRQVTCPHCGHHYPITLDLSAEQQDYYESCPACCAEFIVHQRLELDEKVSVEIDGDDEQIY